MIYRQSSAYQMQGQSESEQFAINNLKLERSPRPAGDKQRRAPKACKRPRLDEDSNLDLVP